ncbi:MAG: helix-turn-helix domain-containing protein [Candidatus Schekmanbacteria bacterium]|nr:helix-turn-helix domain-containing protein [Candidatus Schekmanbacteria bacterium]
MNGEVLTLRVVAEVLKLAGKTVYSMAKRGVIPAFKVRGEWRIQHPDLTASIEARKHPRTQTTGDREGGPPSKEEETAERSSRAGSDGRRDSGNVRAR